MGRSAAHLVLSVLAGCAPTLTPAAMTPASGRTPEAPVEAAPRPIAPAARTLYAPDEALRDAISGPLELVGVGGWPGIYRRLSCMYRNKRVFVVDEKCGSPSESNFVGVNVFVHVLSPARGRLTLSAEASAPINTIRRADYKTFASESEMPRSPPASLTLSMSYEDVVAYQTNLGKGPGSCSAGTQRPTAFCSKDLGISASDYVTQTEPFLHEPPDAWYELVRGLMTLRKQARASIHPAALLSARLAAWGSSWARDRNVDVDEYNMKRVGNSDGVSAPIVTTADGGALIVGTTLDRGVQVPAVLRADANATQRWLKALPQKGFVTHERTSIVAAPDGAIVLAQGFPDPTWKSVYRVIKIDDRGGVRWQWIGYGKDKHQIAQIVTAKLTVQGNVVLQGYIQLVADGDVHAWMGELDAAGKLVRDEVGAVLPDKGASL